MTAELDGYIAIRLSRSFYTGEVRQTFAHVGVRLEAVKGGPSSTRLNLAAPWKVKSSAGITR